MPTNKAIGTSLEYAVKKLFVDNGWDVYRGANSAGTALGVKADLIATRKRLKYEDTAHIKIAETTVGEDTFDTVLVQCKCATIKVKNEKSRRTSKKKSECTIDSE